MKNHLTTLLLISLFGAFSLFITLNNQSKTVLSITSPTKIKVDFDNNKTVDNEESVCIEGVEAFSLEPDEEFFNKYSKSLQLSKSDMISLGYLAQDFAQKTLTNQKIKIKYGEKVTNECKFASVSVNGTDYKATLLNSGFGLIDGKPYSTEKFKKNLENARKLHLVVLNHRSGKVHTLDCPYGNAAHDKVIIPQNQLPKNTTLCKFCNNFKEKQTKKYKLKKDIDIFNIPNVKQPPMAVSDGSIKVLYTDFTKTLIPSNKCSSNICHEFVRQTYNAKESIDIAIYGYDEIPEITSALKHAKARGVNIRFVYDESFDPAKTYYKSNNIITNLSTKYRSDKTETKSQTNMLMHNKFIIFDRKTVFTGSMNFSRPGTSGYDVNDVVIVNSKEIAELYTKEFEQMLSGKFHTKKDKLNINNRFKLGSSEVEVYFSPKDKTSTRIIQLIKNAKSYIYIPAFLITHTNISNELITAKQRGVDVRIIIDANSTSTRNTKHQILRQNGILLKTENYAGKLHSKTMIIDDEYLITGSMNFSNSGENKNDENVLIIRNSKIAQAHKKFFLYLWTVIPNKYIEINARPEGFDSIGSCTDGVDNNFNGRIDKQEVFCK